MEESEAEVVVEVGWVAVVVKESEVEVEVVVEVVVEEDLVAWG